MNVAFLCLGGNIGDRNMTLQKAIVEINNKIGSVISKSKIYETQAWGVTKQNAYLNQCICVHTKYTSQQLIKKILAIEKQLGRLRTNSLTYEARTIDIDILFYNDDIIESKNLVIPHPRLHLRKFVLTPMNDIAPQLKHPVLNKSINNLLKTCKDNNTVNEYLPKVKNIFIALEGNIGAGKTTLAKALAKKLNAHFLPEKFEENTLLPLFYKNKKKLALLTEFSFLIERQNYLTNFFKTSTHNIIVSDFHLDKCLCFAEANLTKSDFIIYKKNFKIIKETLPEPDVVVFIDVETKLLIKNIKIRNREMEQSIKPSYLNKVGNAYAKNYSSNKNKAQQLLKIPITQYTKNTSNDFCDLIIKTLNL